MYTMTDPSLYPGSFVSMYSSVGSLELPGTRMAARIRFGLIVSLRYAPSFGMHS